MFWLKQLLLQSAKFAVSPVILAAFIIVRAINGAISGT